MLQDAFFDTKKKFCIALCEGLAMVLVRNYHINAVAEGSGSRAVNREFTNELRPIFEYICSELKLSKSILDSVNTLDIEVSLRIEGFHLYVDILTFPPRV